ncbi:potassium channel family protein [Bacillus massilinigeriensis]|uniref:potassium channel family protein n=1 Tax=Bacillus massilionigeriensis TaxID=1805475 RepID=UPI00096AE8E5|nr:NAD-binding protein [Bacillus massilionigeriensis]
MNVIIIGGGQTGAHIGRVLLNNALNIKIIEYQEAHAESLVKDFSKERVIHGSGTDPNTLEAAGIKTADVLVAVAGSDEVNLVASTIAKFEFSVPRVVARVNNPRNAWLYNRDMGVDVLINQAEIMAQMVVEEMDMEHVATLMKLNRGNLSIAKITVNGESNAISKEIKDLNIPPKCVLISILRNADEVVIPRGNTIIEANDQILFLADQCMEKEINQIFSF